MRSSVSYHRNGHPDGRGNPCRYGRLITTRATKTNLLPCLVILYFGGRDYPHTDRILLIFVVSTNVSLIASGAALVGVAPTGPDVSVFAAMVMAGIFLLALHAFAYNSEARKRRKQAAREARGNKPFT